MAAGSYHGQVMRPQLPTDTPNQRLYQSAVTMHRPDKHGLFRALANSRSRIAQLDSRQERGFFMKIISHRREPRRYYAYCLVSPVVDDIESHCRSKIDNHNR